MKKAVIFQADESFLTPYEVRGRLENVYTKNVVNKIAAITQLHDLPVAIDESGSFTDILAEAEVMFATWKMPSLSEAQIKKYLPKLKIVFYGAGSVQYFARPYLNLGIKVVSAWAASGIPVIEYTSSLIQLSLKGFLPVQKIAKHDWRKARALSCRYPGVYSGSTVGIIGTGIIGKGIIKSLNDKNIRLLAYDPYCKKEALREIGVHMADSLIDLFSQSNVVANVAADLPGNKEMLLYEHFSAMPRYSTFINTGRNAQVHVDGLVRVLNIRRDITAFLDVTDPNEPPSNDNPLLTCENLFLTPHIAGSMGCELERQGMFMAEECENWLAGRELAHEVTIKMLDTMA